MCFLVFYWPASVSDWCYSCTLHKRRRDIPRPRVSGLGGIISPRFTKCSIRNRIECVTYYRQMSSWLVRKAAQINCVLCLTHALVAWLHWMWKLEWLLCWPSMLLFQCFMLIPASLCIIVLCAFVSSGSLAAYHAPIPTHCQDKL